FTLCASKRPHYILPALVPLALLAATGIAEDRERATAAVRFVARWTALAGALALLGSLAGLGVGAGHGVLSRPVMSAAGLFLVAWGCVTLLGGVRPARAIVCCALFAPGLGIVLLGPLTSYAQGRSSMALASHLEAGAPVVFFDTFRPSLPFYLGRPVV